MADGLSFQQLISRLTAHENIMINTGKFQILYNRVNRLSLVPKYTTYKKKEEILPKKRKGLLMKGTHKYKEA